LTLESSTSLNSVQSRLAALVSGAGVVANGDGNVVSLHYRAGSSAIKAHKGGGHTAGPLPWEDGMVTTCDVVEDVGLFY